MKKLLLVGMSIVLLSGCAGLMERNDKPAPVPSMTPQEIQALVAESVAIAIQKAEAARPVVEEAAPVAPVTPAPVTLYCDADDGELL